MTEIKTVQQIPPYPEGEVVGACVCGSWPGGECLRCRCPVIERDNISFDDLQKMYAGQCRLTDELAAKLEAGRDKALLARIAELEADLATMNKRYAAVLSANAGKVDAEAGLPYGIVDPDYARIFTIARVLAWSEGYAITMHGSFTRDLDLLAVPWSDRVCEPAHLVRRIEAACGLKQSSHPPSERPHGRHTWTLLFPEFGDPRFVDLSVMTCAPSPAQQAIDAGKV